MLGQVGKRRGKQRHAAAAIALRRKRRATLREPPKQVAEAEREELEPSGWSRPSASDRSSDVHSDGGELSGCMGEVASTGVASRDKRATRRTSFTAFSPCSPSVPSLQLTDSQPAAGRAGVSVRCMCFMHKRSSEVGPVSPLTARDRSEGLGPTPYYS